MNKIINKFTDKIICKGEESIKELAVGRKGQR